MGLSAMGFNGVQWASLTQKALIPLAFSPLISVVLAFLFFPLVRSGLSQWRGHCLCLLPMERARLVLGQKGSVRVGSAGFQIIPVMDSPECNIPRGLSLRIGTDTLHWLTSGLTSFARGLNDGPKIAALLIGLTYFSGLGSEITGMTFGVVAISMGLGGVLSGRKVTEVLAEKVTRMDHIEGFSANLTTAFLVIIASHLGLPVSTTHVSSSAIIGTGLRKGVRQLNVKTVGGMALAWVVTLPIAGLLSAGCYFLFSNI